MLMVYYEGDATAEVEGHFIRAMKEASASSTTTTEGERKRGEQCNIILALFCTFRVTTATRYHLARLGGSVVHRDKMPSRAVSTAVPLYSQFLVHESLRQETGTKEKRKREGYIRRLLLN